MTAEHFHVSNNPKDFAHVSSHHSAKHRHRIFIAVAVAVFVVAGVVVYLA